MAEEINFKVNADTKSAEKSIDKLEKGFKGLPGIFGKAANGLKGFGKTLASIGNAVKTGLGFGILLGEITPIPRDGIIAIPYTKRPLVLPR